MGLTGFLRKSKAFLTRRIAGMTLFELISVVWLRRLLFLAILNRCISVHGQLSLVVFEITAQLFANPN
jgi:hypothetical protein